MYDYVYTSHHIVSFIIIHTQIHLDDCNGIFLCIYVYIERGVCLCVCAYACMCVSVCACTYIDIDINNDKRNNLRFFCNNRNLRSSNARYPPIELRVHQNSIKSLTTTVVH